MGVTAHRAAGRPRCRGAPHRPVAVRRPVYPAHQALQGHLSADVASLPLSRWPSFMCLTNLVQPQEEPGKRLYTLARFCPAVAATYPASFHHRRCCHHCHHNSNASPWRSGGGGGGCRHRSETPILLARAQVRAKLARVFMSVRPFVVLCRLCCMGGGRKKPRVLYSVCECLPTLHKNAVFMVHSAALVLNSQRRDEHIPYILQFFSLQYTRWTLVCRFQSIKACRARDHRALWIPLTLASCHRGHRSPIEGVYIHGWLVHRLAISKLNPLCELGSPPNFVGLMQPVQAQASLFHRPQVYYKLD